jgi:O-antigen ligase
VPLPRRAGWVALVVICAGLALAIVVGSKESARHPLSAGASRYVTLQSNRYAYWRVAVRAFAHEPLHGVGAGGWSVWWLRYRPFDDFAQDAHSLPLQTLAELGLVGIAALGAFFAGVALAARDAYRRAPMRAAGPIAAVVAYAAHSPLDWDWQMPAVTLVALILAGMLLALAETSRPRTRSP